MTNNRNLEFFTTPDGDILVKKEDGGIEELNEKSREMIDFFFEKIRTEYVEAFGGLSAYYKPNSWNILYFKYLCVRRFIKCNMSNFDTLKYDLDADNIFHFEQVLCPMRGECKLQNVVCNPKFNTNLSDREKMVCDIYCRPANIETVAEELFLSAHTVGTHLKNIYRKLGVSSQAELIRFKETHSKL